ncbi:probable signal peptidase complex subunit 2 [Dendronephthya gigantea]|uniref:probable signal peptidase complex subunit 2 n=1 Tax=Dendronephthya gigantea TaxID=151771 RepID=UPI001069032E|nr:probable signal peptidase complex subunit 2 [Dendronephthya gigantea]
MASRKGGKQGLLSKWEIGDEKPVQIDKWDGNAVKNALDDAVRKILTEHLKFVENNSVIDTRLALCTVACLFAIGALIYDYITPFPNSRTVLILCVLAYFILMGVLTVFTTFREKNYIVFANEKDKAGMGPDHLWSARSTLKRYDDIYELTLCYKDGETQRSEEQTMKKSVASWFDENGELHFDIFLNDVMEMQKGLKKEKAQ